MMFPSPAAMRCTALAALATLAFTDTASAASNLPRPRPPFVHEDHSFEQEIRLDIPALPPAAAQASTCLASSPDGTLWVGTLQGVYALQPAATAWRQPESTIGHDPVFAIHASAGQVFVGAWNGLHQGTVSGLRPVPGIQGPISALSSVANPPANPGDNIVFAAGPQGVWRLDPDGRTHSLAVHASRQVRALAASGPEELWLATGLGLARWTPAGTTVLHAPHSLLSSTIHDVARAGDGSLYAGGLGGMWQYRGTRLVQSFAPVTGLPSTDVQCVAVDPRERPWLGTPLGLAVLEDQRWTLRHSRRWLPNDDVRDIAIQPQAGGSFAVWAATGGGVGGLGHRRLTLADKAAHYAAICEARHVRPPGIVEKCRLPVPGDVSRWEVEDDDNDGGYTALYLAMESFHFAATGDEASRARARRAFGALELLRTVTDMPGFFARSVVPAGTSGMHDANETLTPAAQARAQVQDPRDKYVPVRWRPSRDGRWLWKGDTSSDEVTAHMFGCFWFFELAADAGDRSRVKEHVCSIVDHLLRHGYTLVDQDGRHTRWGVWAPERLNADPDWANERGINSVELLSYLKLAAHVSGEARYEDHYRALLDQHGYRANVRLAKNLNPAGRTHIDDELLAFAWPPLLLLEKDRGLRRLYRETLDRWHEAVEPDAVPFFELLYLGLSGSGSGSSSGALRAKLSRAVNDLQLQPLDLVRWTVDNSAREDVRIVRRPELERRQTDRLLAPVERGTPRTDQNTLDAVQGDGGQTESDGVFWLLPYWMGRFYGVIR